MEAFILESLVGTYWRRGGQTYWTIEAACDEGQRLLKRKLAQRIRILAVHVNAEAVVELPTARTAAIAV